MKYSKQDVMLSHSTCVKLNPLSGFKILTTVNYLKNDYDNLNSKVALNETDEVKQHPKINFEN